MARMNDRAYQQPSSIADDMEGDDRDYEPTSEDIDEPTRSDRPPPPREEQYIAALRHRFPNRPKTDYAYSRPLGPLNPSAEPPSTQSTTTTTQPRTTTTTTTPTNTTGPRSGPYQTSVRPTSTGTNTSDISDDKGFLRPALRRVTPDQQNTYARRIADETATTPSTSQPKPVGPGSGPTVRINEQNIEPNRPAPTIPPRTTGIPKTQESVFEKVHSQGGTVSYLGTGTFSQFEQCLRACLERERRELGIVSHITRQDIPPNIPVHDYGLDAPVISSSTRQGLYPDCGPSVIDYRSRYAPEFSLEDIRYVNAALSRQGIPLLPLPRPCPDPYPYSISMISPTTTVNSFYSPGPRMSGDVVSACRLVEDDPAVLQGRNLQ